MTGFGYEDLSIKVSGPLFVYSGLNKIKKLLWL